MTIQRRPSLPSNMKFLSAISLRAVNRLWLSMGKTIACALVLAGGCAQVHPPSGGPEDETKPFVLAFSPEHEETGVAEDQQLSITWSEWMDHRSVENGLLFNPPHLGNPHFKWKGPRLRIRFDSSFHANSTYLVSISSSVKDLHGVALDTARAWAFSTGEHLSRGEIGGELLGGIPGNAIAAAYRVTDSMDLRKSLKKKADYLVSVSADGIFRFQFMNAASYRIFVFQDEDGNQKHGMGRERIAIPPYDCFAREDSSGIEKLRVILFPSDTSGLELVSAQSPNPRTVALEFNDDIPLRSLIQKANYGISTVPDSLGKPLKIHALAAGKTNREVTLITDYQRHSQAYKVFATELVSLTGRKMISGSDTAMFYGNVARDTVPPRVASVYPAHHQKDVLLDDSIALAFSEPINFHYLKTRIHLSDTNGNVVPTRFAMAGLGRVIMRPVSPWEQGLAYRLRLTPGALVDLFRNANRDTLSFEFETLRRDDISRSISGRIVSTNKASTVLVWRNVRGGREFRHVAVSDSFFMPGIPAGDYLVHAYKDVNRNGRYDPGSLVPFEFSEPLAALPDTMELRGLWEYEGVNFRFGR